MFPPTLREVLGDAYFAEPRGEDIGQLNYCSSVHPCAQNGEPFADGAEGRPMGHDAAPGQPSEYSSSAMLESPSWRALVSRIGPGGRTEKAGTPSIRTPAPTIM
jgi:hypothetical protein